MATIVTAGTEILRAHHFRLPSAVGPHVLIYGEQHHIYTVLSIICHCSYDDVGNQNDGLTVGIKGYNALEGGSAGSADDVFIFVHRDAAISGRDTFVWDNKFSFNGHEPVDFTGPMNDAAKQNAIAAQGDSGTNQILYATKGHSNDSWHMHVTFIDQNNA